MRSLVLAPARLTTGTQSDVIPLTIPAGKLLLPVLTEGTGAPLVQVGRGGRLKRLFVCARGHRLDMALAAGANPDSSVELSLRAQMLLRRSTRVGLARELRRVIRDAKRPRGWCDPTAPVPRTVILDNEPAIQEIAEWLEELSPLDTRGVAQVRLLLRDGGSAIYRRGDSSDLEEVLQRITEALLPSPEIWMST